MIVEKGIFIHVYMTNNNILNYNTCSTNQMLPLSPNYYVIARFLISKHLYTQSANAFITISSSQVISHINLAESSSVLKEGALSTIYLKKSCLSLW